MMRHMIDRLGSAFLVAAAMATAALGAGSPAEADPDCPPSGCPHGRAHSPSYQDGYKSEHDYYSTPAAHEFLKNEMKQGYNTGLVCQLEVTGGPQPANLGDWLAGCADALHDLGFKP
jgi:hypothetical protein